MKVRYTTTIGPESVKALEAIRTHINKSGRFPFDRNTLLLHFLRLGFEDEAKKSGVKLKEGWSTFE